MEAKLPDGGRVRGTLTVHNGGRVRGTPTVHDGGRVWGTPTVHDGGRVWGTPRALASQLHFSTERGKLGWGGHVEIKGGPQERSHVERERDNVLL